MKRFNRKTNEDMRRALRQGALTRPGLRHPSDGFMRTAPQSPISAPMKTVDPKTRAIIDAAMMRRRQ